MDPQNPVRFPHPYGVDWLPKWEVRDVRERKINQPTQPIISKYERVCTYVYLQKASRGVK